MPKFKPGDRVRVSDKNEVDYGLVGTVIQAGVVTTYININHYCTFMNNQLTLLDPPTPKRVEVERTFRRYDVTDTIRMPHYGTVGKGAYRVWNITGVHLGATHQESTYALVPVDIEANEPIHVPCLMLETHPEVEKV